jgi:cytochrome P450
MSLPDGPKTPASIQMLQWVVRPIPFMHECQERYGDVFTIRLKGLGTYVVVSEPEHIKEFFTGDGDVFRAGEANVSLGPLLGETSVLLLDGAAHMRQRRLLLPPFHGERMQAYATLMRDIADESIDAWPLDAPFAIHEPMQRITLAVILRTVFGVAEGPRYDALAAQLTRMLERGMSPWVLMAILRRDILGLTPWSKFLAERRNTDAMLLDEIARRRAESDRAQRSDVLSLLLSATDEHGEPMQDRELRDELLTLLVAGHETSASTLAWAFERMLTHPHVLDRARDEIERVTGGGPLEPAHLPKLEYVDAVLKETLRIRPILPMVARRLTKPVRFAGCDLPAGVMVGACIYLAQRNPASFPAPGEFRPERWLGVKADPYTWLPFGGGIRRCIGMAFAQYEMKIVLAAALRRISLRLASPRPVRIARRGITLVPGGGTRVVVTDRRPRERAREKREPTNAVA